MLISRSSSLFGLSKKPGLYVDAGRSLGADGSASTQIRNAANGATHTDTGNNPKVKYAGLNGRKTLNYDASKFVLLSATVAAGSVTLITVEKRTNASTNWFFMEHGTDTASQAGCYMYGNSGTGTSGFRQGGQTAFANATTAANWTLTAGVWYTRITRCDHTNQLFKFRVNGTDVPTTIGGGSAWGTATGHTSNFYLGRRGSGGLDYRGECAFAAMYSGYLSDAECARVEELLRRRFKHY